MEVTQYPDTAMSTYLCNRQLRQLNNYGKREAMNMVYFIAGLTVGILIGAVLFAVLTANDDDPSRGHP